MCRSPSRCACADVGRVHVAEPVVGDDLARGLQDQAAQRVALVRVGVHPPVACGPGTRRSTNRPRRPLAPTCLTLLRRRGPGAPVLCRAFAARRGDLRPAVTARHPRRVAPRSARARTAPGRPGAPARGAPSACRRTTAAPGSRPSPGGRRRTRPAARPAAPARRPRTRPSDGSSRPRARACAAIAGPVRRTATRFVAGVTCTRPHAAAPAPSSNQSACGPGTTGSSTRSGQRRHGREVDHAASRSGAGPTGRTSPARERCRARAPASWSVRPRARAPAGTSIPPRTATYVRSPTVDRPEPQLRARRAARARPCARPAGPSSHAGPARARERDRHGRRGAQPQAAEQDLEAGGALVVGDEPVGQPQRARRRPRPSVRRRCAPSPGRPEVLRRA